MNWLENARNQRNLSPTDLARKTGICRQRLWKIERGLVLPTRAQSEALEAALGVQGFPCSDDLIDERRLAGLSKRRPYDLELHNQERWRLAFKVWGYRIQRLRISPRTLAWMQNFIRVDSALEALAWILLVAAGCKVFFGNPQHWGYRRHTVTDSLGVCLGERNLPGLHYQDQDNQIWIWPQVSLRPSEIVSRPDAVVLFNSDWMHLEVNGQGHNAEKDAYRAEQRNTPTIQLSEKEIKDATNLLELVIRRALECR